MVAGCMSRALQRVLSAQGRLIARHPTPFVVIPILLTGFLGYSLSGILNKAPDANTLELYVPKQGLSATGKEQMQKYFGDTDESEFDPINGVSFSVIVMKKDRTDIINSDFMTEYLWLRQKLEGITVRYRQQDIQYSQVCFRSRVVSRLACMPDFVQMLTARGLDGYRDIRLMKYPRTQWSLPGIQIPVDLTVPLGGVNTSSRGLITSAQAALMTFTFSYQHFPAAQSWELELRQVLAKFKSERISVRYFTMQQFQSDLASMATKLHQLMPALLLVIVVFCILACCVADWVHSKPWVAIGGVTCTLMATCCGFGLTRLIGVDTVDIVFVAPFLMLSVGVDDMFLMLAAWRRTSGHLSVEQRMAHTFGDAAVSITITSVTDALSFAIGAFTVFPAVRFFCIYTAVSLVFIYLFQISLFGAVLALSGLREAQNRHCFLMIKLSTSAEAEEQDRSLTYKVFCTGGDNRLNEDIYGSTIDGTNVVDTAAGNKPTGCLPIKPSDNIFNLFFQRYYAPLLRFKGIKSFAAVSYIVYLAMAIYGTTTVRIGMNYAELLPDGSRTSAYLTEFGEYFAHSLSSPLEVLLPTMDLSQPEHQHAVLEIIRTFEHGLYTGKADYWLIDFAEFYRVNRGSRQQFYLLLNEFLQQPQHQKFQPHVKFDPLQRLVISRCLISTHNIAFGQERFFLEGVKQILTLPQMHNASVLPAMVQTVGAATVAMLLVSFLLIPKPACSLCLAACIISTNLGVLGAMSLWGVRVDIISMITVLMSVGISVDFVAHVSYFYVQAVETGIPLSKAQRALRYLGLPIMQGALSTMCGMAVLLAIQAYMVRAFVKTLLLVIIFGLYHGLLLLPIVLSMFIKESPRAGKTRQIAIMGAGLSILDGTMKKGAKNSDSVRPIATPPTTVTTNTDSSSTDSAKAHKPASRVGTLIKDQNWSMTRKMWPGKGVASPSPRLNSSQSRKSPAAGSNATEQLRTSQTITTAGSTPHRTHHHNVIVQEQLQRALPISQITRSAKVLTWLTAHPNTEQYPVYSSTQLATS